MSRRAEMERWGIPDWKLESAYPKPAETDDSIWRWEFLRRRPDYRREWEERYAASSEDQGGLLFERGFDFHMFYRFGVMRVADPSRSMSAASLRQLFAARSGFAIVPTRYAMFVYGVRLARAEAAGLPQRIKEIERLLLDVVAAEDSAGLLDYRFDISRPLGAQISEAQRILLAEQETFSGKRNTPRPRKLNWPLFLRALDARECGASYAEMRAALWPDEWDCGQKTEQSARDTFKQAVHLRDNFPI